MLTSVVFGAATEPGVPGGCTVQPCLWGHHHCTCSRSPALDPAPWATVTSQYHVLRPTGPQAPWGGGRHGPCVPCPPPSPLRVSILCPHLTPSYHPGPGLPSGSPLGTSEFLGLRLSWACRMRVSILSPNSLLPKCTVLVPLVASQAVALYPENTTQGPSRAAHRGLA